MPRIHGEHVCACHGEPLGKDRQNRNCVVKRRLRTRKYRATVGGHTAKTAANQRRVWVGHDYICSAETPGQADALKAHIKERLSEFKQKQRAACGTTAGACS